MSVALLAEIGLKSLATAGITLVLLHLLRQRSAAERSLVGHAGLAATLALPVFMLAVPQWPVKPPEAIGWIERTPVPQPQALPALPPTGRGSRCCRFSSMPSRRRCSGSSP